MPGREHDDELRSEQGYVEGLYTRLDDVRARTKGNYRAALRAPVDLQDGGTFVDRDAEVRAVARAAEAARRGG